MPIPPLAPSTFIAGLGTDVGPGAVFKLDPAATSPTTTWLAVIEGVPTDTESPPRTDCTDPDVMRIEASFDLVRMLLNGALVASAVPSAGFRTTILPFVVDLNANQVMPLVTPGQAMDVDYVCVDPPRFCRSGGIE